MTYVLITGVSTGIGYAAATYLIEKGYFVFGSVRKMEDAARLVADHPNRFKPLLFDVTDAEAIEAARKEVALVCGEAGLGGLINNAGIAVSGPLLKVSIEEWQKQFDVNVFGLIRVTQAFLPLLGARKDCPHTPGKIINISSVSGRFTAPFIGPYAASKYAVEAITDALRRELLLYGIDAISIQPGPIQTPIWDKTKAITNSFEETDYEKMLPGVLKMIEQSEATAIPPLHVARCIHKILTSNRPKTRYIVASDKWRHYLAANWIPDRMADGMVKKLFLKVYKSLPWRGANDRS